MGAELRFVRGELAEHVREPATSTEADASARVAGVVEADERLFDDALRLASARHLLGLAMMVAWASMAVMAILLARSRSLRTISEPRGSVCHVHRCRGRDKDGSNE